MPEIPLHWMLLRDRYRLDCYERALRARVRPGDVVLDLGSGTGILGLLALRAGASRVISVEKRPIIHLARALAAANGVLDRIMFLEGRSDRIECVERADLLVTETLGGLAFDEEIVPFVQDARRRLLRPNARIVPSGIDLCAVPVQAAGLHEGLRGMKKVRGLRFGPFQDLLMQSALSLPRLVGRPLAEAQRVVRVRLDRGAATAPPPHRLQGSRDYPVQRGGTLHGFRLWFEARLAPKVTLSTRGRTSWPNPFLPLIEPVPVRRGDRLRLRLSVDGGTQVTWDYELVRGGRRLLRRVQSTFLADPRLHLVTKPANVRRAARGRENPK